MNCVACKQPSAEEQPFYCLDCSIPIPMYQNGVYLGGTELYCPDCDTKMSQASCSQCKYTCNLCNPPISHEIDPDLSKRQDKRAEIAQQLLSGTEEAQKMITNLGIGHLPPAEQGAALAALAMEKMNFYSNDYNFTEGHTLADLGYGLTLEIGEQWAINVTGTILAMYYNRSGKPMLVADLLLRIYRKSPEDTQVQRLRKMEVLAHLALSYRLSGNAPVADEAVELVQKKIEQELQKMEIQIEAYLKGEERFSEYIGIKERTTIFPRVDYLARILVILIEEGIVRGNSGKFEIKEEVFDRLLQLSNIIRILGEMTPVDDKGFFAAHLRDYLRLFNGVFWYDDVILGGPITKQRLVIWEAFERVRQWIAIIPGHFWIVLKPSRLLEIFMRAEAWNKKIDVTLIINEILHITEKIHQPSFNYVFAEALANSGRLDQATAYLREIIEYKGVDETLAALTNNLLDSINLEKIGILTGVKKEVSWIIPPITIKLEDIKSPWEPESYLKEEFKDPVLRLSFEYHQEIIQLGIAIFGEVLTGHFSDFIAAITTVGDRTYNSSSWNTPAQAPGQTITGVRMDILILRTRMKNKSIVLLFEGKTQEIIEKSNQVEIKPSSLLLLRGIIQSDEIESKTIIRYLSDLMINGIDTQYPTDMYVLKK